MKGSEARTLTERYVEESPNVPRYDLVEWSRDFGVVAGITGAKEGFNLGLWGDDTSGNALERWNRFLESFDPPFSGSVVSHQHHGRKIAFCENVEHGLLLKEGYDGHITAEKGNLLAVVVADCVPVYLVDTHSNAIALLHAGWRGTAANILANGVKELNSLFGTEVSNIVMHCGVSICGRCYEVGPEVVEQLFGHTTGEPERIDLRAILSSQAFELGISRVTNSSRCTVCDKTGRFHSHRASGGSKRRMVAYLGMPVG